MEVLYEAFSWHRVMVPESYVPRFSLQRRFFYMNYVWVLTLTEKQRLPLRSHGEHTPHSYSKVNTARQVESAPPPRPARAPTRAKNSPYVWLKKQK